MSSIYFNIPVLININLLIYKLDMMYFFVLLFSLFSSINLAADELPPARHVEPYNELRISQEEKDLIRKLLFTMAESSIFELLFEKGKLEKIGERINVVHPVRFLGTVFSDPRLVYCMKEIYKSSFKWDGFSEGFCERMRKEAAAGNLVMYLPGFAKAVKRPLDTIMTYVDVNDFEGLVKYLIKS